MKMKTELAWSAGFFDGEGSVCCSANNGRPYSRIQLSIGQKDDGKKVAETLRRFKKAVGYGYIYRKANLGQDSNQHQFNISKASEVKTALKLLWPYLSTTKKKQATKALTLLKEGRKKLRRYNGR